MRCLQIADAYNADGGMERFIYHFSRKFIKKGFETAVAAFDLEDDPRWGDDRIETMPIGGSCAELEKKMKTFSPDLIVWHASPRSAACVEKLSKDYPVAATVHGVLCPSGARLFRDRDEVCCRASGPGCYPRWYFRKCGSNVSPFEAARAVKNHKQMMNALKSCRRVYAISHAVKRFLAIEGVPEDRITVFDNTLGGILTAPPLQLPANKDRLDLLFTGRLVYAKGVQYLIRAVKLLLDRGVPAHCTIVGDGWYKEKLVRLTDELGLADFVTFAGKVDGREIHAWYDRCDLAAVPSIWPEPAGLVVPEARMKGKPVVVFQAGGLPEWSAFMDGIYVAKHADEKSLADVICQVVKGHCVPRLQQTEAARDDLIQDLWERLAVPDERRRWC